MKPSRVFLALLALGLPVGVSAAQSQKPAPAEAKPEPPPEWAGLFGGASLPVVWQSAGAAATRITAAIGARSFDGVPEWAETVHLAAHALEDQVRLEDPERRKRLGGALRQAAKIADEVIEAARQREPEQLAESFRRLQAALQLAALRLPPEVVKAEPQEVRFVKASAPVPAAQADPVAKKKK